MILSIIIPVYNVEKYVEKCIRSCENQDIPKEDYEVIVVNDGSPDGSLAIVERVAKEYPNIKVISQENQGLSGARNTGLAAAQGEYIWFVDSDDWIEENCLKGLIEKLVDDIDILQIPYILAYEDGTTKTPAQKHLDGIHSGKEITEQGGLAAPAQFSVFRSKFVKDNDLKFYRGIYHEDSELKPKLVYLAKKISFYEKPVYYYLQRTTGSITSSFSLKRAKDMLFVNRRLFDFSRNLEKSAVSAFNEKIGLNMNSLLFGYHFLEDNEKKEVRELLKDNRDLFVCMKNTGNLKYRLEGIVFLISIPVGFKFHKILRNVITT